MLHSGDVIREAEFQRRELERALAQRQARVDALGWQPRHKPSLRDTYYRRLASLGRRVCGLGLTVGCTLEAHACRQRAGWGALASSGSTRVEGC
jgi:hypothetical protein